VSSVTEQQQALRPRGGLSPRKKQRISRGIQYAVLVIVVVVLAAIADWPAISQSFLNMDVAREGLPELFTVALKNTVIYTITGYAFGSSWDWCWR